MHTAVHLVPVYLYVRTVYILTYLWVKQLVNILFCMKVLLSKERWLSLHRMFCNNMVRSCPLKTGSKLNVSADLAPWTRQLTINTEFNVT